MGFHGLNGDVFTKPWGMFHQLLAMGIFSPTRPWEYSKRIPGLVNIQKTIEHGHRNSELSHEKWWFSLVMGQFTRGYDFWICQQHSDFWLCPNMFWFFFPQKNMAIFSWDNLMPIRWSFCWGTYFCGANMKNDGCLGNSRQGFWTKHFFELIKS